MAAVLGFSVIDYGNAALASYRVPGTDVSVSLRKETAPLFIEFARWFHIEIEPLRKGECWGHAYRAVRGATNWSKHSAGIAIDLNAPRHPLGRRGTFSPSEAAKIQAKAKSLGLLWGGSFTKRADEMHIEQAINRAAALDLVRRLQTPPKRAPAKRTVPASTYIKAKAGTRVLELLDRGDDVKFLQRFLGLADDGVFGTATKTKVTAYQKMRGLAADGIVGPKTWTAIASGTPLR